MADEKRGGKATNWGQLNYNWTLGGRVRPSKLLYPTAASLVRWLWPWATLLTVCEIPAVPGADSLTFRTSSLWAGDFLTPASKSLTYSASCSSAQPAAICLEILSDPSAERLCPTRLLPTPTPHIQMSVLSQVVSCASDQPATYQRFQRLPPWVQLMCQSNSQNSQRHFTR